MDTPVEARDRMTELQAEVRSFLRAYAGGMPEDTFTDLVHDVARMRFRDEQEKKALARRTTGEFSIASSAVEHDIRS